MLVLLVKREWLYSYYFFRFLSGSDKSELPQTFMGMLGSDRARTKDIYFAYNSSLPTGCKHRIACEEEFQFHSAVSWCFFPS